MTLRRLLVMAAVVGLIAAACNDDDGGTTATEEETADQPAEDEAADDEATDGFDESVLGDAIVRDGDAGVNAEPGAEHTLDVIWPADAFPEDREAYEDAGFVAGTVTVFDAGTPDFRGFSAAHLFPDAAGAEAALAVVEAWHRDPANLELAFGIELAGAEAAPAVVETAWHRDPADVASTTGVEPGSVLAGVDDLDVPVGDDSAAFILSNDEVQVVVIVWSTGNVVHILRAVMMAGAQSRVEMVQALAEAIDDRMTAG